MAVVVGAGEAQVALQRLAFGDGQHMDEVDDVLVVEPVEFRVVVASGQLRGPLVAESAEVEAVAVGAGDDALGAAGGDGHVLAVRGVALADLAQAAGIDGQAGELGGVQVRALEGLRQQPRVVGQHGGQLGQQGADLQHAAGGAQLGGQAQFAVVVGGAIDLLAVARQQAGAGAVGAGVELDAEQAEGVDAKADGACGVTGFVAQQEALGPFLLLGLGGAVLAEVAIEVEVAQFEAGLAVHEKVGGCQCR
ncbi:hypothetical protein D3C76_847910 [compost metagenome]